MGKVFHPYWFNEKKILPEGKKTKVNLEAPHGMLRKRRNPRRRVLSAAMYFTLKL